MSKTGVVVEVEVWRSVAQPDEKFAALIGRAVETALLNVFALLEAAGIAEGRECPMGVIHGPVVLAVVERYRVESLETDDGKERV